ncbi:MAG TPA: type II toxin-antitoxin system HicB family antitoxin [Terracidiphilus sp.]|jgi:predicted HicB family RNase H-like nuclease|nr:type II toxin-antitoxin system HicB family antitoxin [Terracidiphilus sp.]
MMEYKAYSASPIEFNPEENTFSGTVAGLRDVIHFEGSTARELAKAFRDSIDSYLELCAETGQEPDRPFNGKILVRTEPALHRKAALRAAAEGVSLSQWITRQIESAP